MIIIYLRKLYYVCHGYETGLEYDYRNREFKEFIEKENARYYTNLQVVLIGGEMGKWLSLRLPEDIEEAK
jgi:hypothetical protein